MPTEAESRSSDSRSTRGRFRRGRNFQGIGSAVALAAKESAADLRPAFYAVPLHNPLARVQKNLS